MRQTAWQVITGAPSSGKTAVIRELAQRGYRAVPEAARAYVEARMRAGWTPAQIRSDTLAFETRILSMKIATEDALPADSIAFLDRAVPDSIAYFTLAGLNPATAVEYSRKIRYANIFMFERLALEKDPVRTETERTAARLDRLLAETYRSLGYAPLHVPRLPVPERVAFILGYLGLPETA
jgi:predicted ATPase